MQLPLRCLGLAVQASGTGEGQRGRGRGGAGGGGGAGRLTLMSTVPERPLEVPVAVRS